MRDAAFELLFKYPAWMFAQGELRLTSPPTAIAFAAVVAVAAVVALATFRRMGRTRRDRVVLGALRVVAVALLVLGLLRPVLSVRAAVPRQSVVGVLVDDSRSMRVADAGGRPRADVVKRELGPGGPLLAALADRFLVRQFRFSSSASAIDSTAALSFGGTETRIEAALRQARDELAGLPVAGFVIVTDGADTAGVAPSQTVLSLKADRVPVFTVGLGAEVLRPDIEIGKIATPRSVLKGTAIVVDVAVGHHGYAGLTLPVDVESDGRILASERVTLGADGQLATARLRFVADTPGAQVFRFRVPAQQGEIFAENNARETLIEVVDRRERVLYVEGEPRFEVKFTRMAVDPDKNLQLVVLQRTAERKYLRLQVDNATELAAGFPTTRDELFAFRGLVLGSMEASAFTGDQLRMIAEFVDRRGGGLLLLGGPRSLAEGGFAGTPVADLSPVALEGAARPAAGLLTLAVSPTRAGMLHPVTLLGPNDKASTDRWKALPPLTSVNRVGAAKPGATVLLTGNPGDGSAYPVLSHQRYGRGRVVSLAVQDAWQWQLHSSVAVEDQTHETFWRQLLRWLVAEAPDRVTLTTSADRVERGDELTLTASVMDPMFLAVNGARVVATVTAPSGATTDVPLRWTGDRDGEYRGSVAPDEDGAYTVKVSATREEGALGDAAAVVRVGPSDAEAFEAGMRAGLLRQLAEDTGGRFYTESTMRRVADDLRYTGRGVTVVEDHDLWDMPVLLGLLLATLFADWGYRKLRGLV